MVDSMAHRLGGRYEVRSLIGRGGMAEVHLGYDTRLHRIVAIKMLRADLARDSVFQARFRREAQAAASLNHPNIVAVYDTGEEVIAGADGRGVSVPYIVMEYVEGHTVKDLLSDGTPVPINEAVEIVSGVLSALEYSHAAGLVHRDIKPGNIMLTTDGKVKVMDFGIARALTDSQATMTQTNAVVGTAQYLSPEQARGEQVDARSDLYSTGVVLFELLTGQPPFRGDSAVAVAYQHVSALPPTPSSITPDVPEALDRVVLKALAKNRDDRYSSAASMRADLIRASRGAQVNAPAATVWAAAAGAQPSPADGAGATETMPVAPPPPPSFGLPTRAGTATSTLTPATGLGLPQGEAENPRKRTWLIVTLILIGVALAVAGIAAALNASNSKTAMVAVPDNLVNMTQADAKTAVEKAGLVWAVSGDTVASDTVTKGNVAKVNPASGKQVEKGSTVTGYLSSGPASVTVPPDLVGMSPADAQAAVEKLGLVWKLGDAVASDTVDSGKIASTTPSPGKTVGAGSMVTGYPSSGSDTVTVPDVSGQTQDAARATLEALGLTVGNVSTADDASQDKDRVISTTPAAGSTAKKGDPIALVVASGDVKVPDNLVGKSQADVVAAIQAVGLQTNVVTQYNDASAGTVYGVSPNEGQKVSKGQTVTVYVSEGPSGESSSATPTPTPSSTKK